MIENETAYLSPKIIGVGNTTIYDLMSDVNGNLCPKFMTIYIKYFRALSEEEAKSLSYYLCKFDVEYDWSLMHPI
jgi:hypothetical protein